MIKISCFSGNEKNVTDGVVIEYTFNDLADTFSEPQEGKKNDGYFVRGALEPFYRKDVNLESSELLILDGDKSLTDENSAPPPVQIHKYLKFKNISHFIYTSHSHSHKVNKYRVIIHCDLPGKTWLRPTTHKICKELNNEGIPLKFVKEMGTWSQPWFVPRRDDPTDGLFEYYHHEGVKYEGDNAPPERGADGNSNTSQEHSTTVERIRQIQSGEVLHDNLVALSWGFVRDGMHPTVVQATLEGIMAACKIKDDRWETRLKDIPRYIRDALPKQDCISIDDIGEEEDEKETHIPWPPGLLGKLSDDALSMQIHQYDEVAVISAVGLVAGIAGRKFNVSRTGLNIYATLIMRTGMGKDSINEFIESALINLNEVGNAYSFLGPGRFTGPTAVFKGLKSARSQICVFTEAGLLLRSRAGDMDGLTRMFLSLYTVSGKNRTSKKEIFSSTEDTISALRAPALSIINEATPETLLLAFKETGSLENGLLPRQSIFRVSRKKPYPVAPKSELSDKCMQRLMELIKKCSNFQAVEDPEAWDMQYDDEIVDDISKHANVYVDLYNEFIGSDITKAIMASRLHVKALKYAAIASVFNHTDAIIRKPEWEWAKELAAFEYNGVDRFFKGSTSNNQHDLATLIGRIILKILNNGYKVPKKQMDKKYRDACIFSKYALSQCVMNNSEINAISDDAEKKSNPRTGLEKVLEYMIRNDFLVRVEDKWGNKKSLYRITKLFKRLMT
ncbi:MAG: hypothetical protein V3R78_12530 [Thermodesulfobacteriota bacterium]